MVGNLATMREQKNAQYNLFHMIFADMLPSSFSLFPYAASFAQLLLGPVNVISAVDWIVVTQWKYKTKNVTEVKQSANVNLMALEN